jgi:hypothetical protein
MYPPINAAGIAPKLKNKEELLIKEVVSDITHTGVCRDCNI